MNPVAPGNPAAAPRNSPVFTAQSVEDTCSRSSLFRQTLWFSAVCLLIVFAFLPAVRVVVNLSLNDQRYSQTALAPLFCILLLYWNRGDIFANARYSTRLGVPLLAACLVPGLILMKQWSRSRDFQVLEWIVFAIALSWIAAFLLCYGVRTCRRAIYAISCLSLAVPIPSAWMDKIITGFQQGSADVSYWILDGLGISVFREGTDFSIPGLNFNIAPECSGIHSGIAFMIIGILSANLFLRAPWSRAVLIVSTIPIAILKNAIRIVVIALLGAYVDRSFIDGPFHHKYGGLVFAPLDFVLFVPLLYALYKIEVRREDKSARGPKKA